MAYLLHRHVGQESDDILDNGNNKTSLVSVLTRHDLDMVSRLESLSDATRLYLHPLSVELDSFGLDGDNILLDTVDSTMHASLLALKDLNAITGLKN